MLMLKEKLLILEKEVLQEKDFSKEGNRMF